MTDCRYARDLHTQASLPRALLASVLSFSGGGGGSGDDGAASGDLVPLIVQAMARLSE